MDINEAFDWIDQYIASLEEHDIPDAYDTRSRDFFQFLKRYDCNVGAVVNLIKRYSGMTPQQIKTRADAEQLKDMMQRYLTSEAYSARRSPNSLQNPGAWAYQNTAFCFDERTEPPDA